MANETEVIRERMEETRNDLSDKLEKLEQQVTDTVQEATSAVADTVQQATSAVTDAMQGARDVVDSVKDSVQGTVDSVKESMDGAVESVKETFNLPRQVERHPWLMVGGAVAVGYVAGKMLDYAPAAPGVARAMSESLRPTSGRFAQAAVSTAGAVGSAAAAAGGVMSTLESMFGPEINKVKELALGALLGVFRDMAVKAAPETMAPQVREIIDGFTTKLGGKPVEGPVLGPRPEEEEAHNGPGGRF